MNLKQQKQPSSDDSDDDFSHQQFLIKYSKGNQQINLSEQNITQKIFQDQSKQSDLQQSKIYELQRLNILDVNNDTKIGANKQQTILKSIQQRSRKLQNSQIEYRSKHIKVKPLQKKSPFNNQNLWTRVIYYQNQNTNNNYLSNKRIQAFFKDGSSFSWVNQTIIYLSAKAIKTRVNFNDIYRSVDLSNKIYKSIKALNTYHQHYFEFSQELTKKLLPLKIINDKVIYKKYKINQYFWQKSHIIQNEQGYQIISNDQNATLILMKDLFKVKLKYLQLSKNYSNCIITLGKLPSLNSITQENQSNALDKYTFHPPINKLPTQNSLQNQIYYGYYQCEKQFSIFNLPFNWYAPIDQVWTYLLVNKIVKHQFMYSDFAEQGVQIRKCTKMQQSVELAKDINQISQINSKETFDRFNSLPLYGKPTHMMKCKWISYGYQNQDKQGILNTQEMIAWLNQQSGMNMLYDSYGYWIKPQCDPTIYFKTINTPSYQYKYSSSSIPLIARQTSLPQRCLHISLTCFLSYIKHNQSISTQIPLTPRKQVNDSCVEIFSQNHMEIGVSKVFENGIIVTKFVDRVMFTLKGNEIRVVDVDGQTFTLNINKKQQFSAVNLKSNQRNPYVRYREHIRYITSLYQKIFHFDQWKQKQQLNQRLNYSKIASQAYISVCDNLKRGI